MAALQLLYREKSVLNYWILVSEDPYFKATIQLIEDEPVIDDKDF